MPVLLRSGKVPRWLYAQSSSLEEPVSTCRSYRHLTLVPYSTRRRCVLTADKAVPRGLSNMRKGRIGGHEADALFWLQSGAVLF
jgi:hypothetical protein